MDTKTTSRRTKLISLDVLKGIAMLMIIVVHNRHFVMQNMDGMRQLINYGQMGCQMFFLISGMSLCFSYFHSTGSAHKLQFWKNFILKRYLRLAPGFLLIILANLLLNYLYDNVFLLSPGFIIEKNPVGLLLNALLLHGFSPSYHNNVAPGGWYVGTAMILYLLFPLVLFIFDNVHKLQKHLVLLLPFVFYMLCEYLLKDIAVRSNYVYYPSNNSYMYFSFINQLPCFSLGLVLYYQYKDRIIERIPRILPLLAFLLTGYYSVQQYLLPDENNFHFIKVPFITSLAFYFLAMFALRLETSKLFSSKGIRALASYGKNSYGIYLVHAFFSWYGIKLLTTTLQEYQIPYHDLTLYFILLVPTIFLSYGFGMPFNRFLTALTAKLGHKKKTS